MSTHNYVFETNIRKIGIPWHTRVLLYKSGVQGGIHYTDAKLVFPICSLNSYFQNRYPQVDNEDQSDCTTTRVLRSYNWLMLSSAETEIYLAHKCSNANKVIILSFMSRINDCLWLS